MFGFGGEVAVGGREWVTNALPALGTFTDMLFGATFLKFFIMVGVGVTIVGQLYRIVMQRGGLSDTVSALGEDRGLSTPAKKGKGGK